MSWKNYKILKGMPASMLTGTVQIPKIALAFLILLAAIALVVGLLFSFDRALEVCRMVVMAVGACIAFWATHSWRRQKKFEQAADLYKFICLVERTTEWACFPGGYTHETSERQKQDDETDKSELSEARDTAYRIKQRFQLQVDGLSKFEDYQAACEMFFPDLVEDMKRIKSIKNEIDSACSRLWDGRINDFDPETILNQTKTVTRGIKEKILKKIKY